MNAKDLRTGSAVSERNNDGSKFSQGGGISLHCDRNKSYQEIGSNSLGKVDVQNARPCAVIGPDRVVPPPATSEAYHIKKGSTEPWPCMDNGYRRPPEYPHKLTNYQNPTRNISPRQTFQENMQRIMVPPTYNAIKVNDDTNYAQVSDRSNGLSKNIKLNMPQEAKFCDVPYAVNPTNNEHKNVRNPETCLPGANPTHTRTAPHGWPPGSVNLRSTRMYSAPELYQYQEYPSCAGPRPVVPRPHRTVPEEPGYVYAEPYYQEGNIRFKPYPTIKERYPQQRYEYIGNYANPFHPPPGFPSHKYEVQKSVAPHPYSPYAPMKYLDSRVVEPAMEGYQRNPQGLGPNYNIQYRNQVIHPNYGVIANSPQNKMHSYPPDAHMKSIPPNKLPYDTNTKTYIEYENSRPKIYPPSESYFVNEMVRMPMKSQVIMPNYSTLNMHNMPPNPYYKKDTHHMKNYEHMAHFRNMDPNINIHNPMSSHAPVFSPNTLAISPTDSNTSNDTAQTLGTSQEDCGYVSQSSTASVRSIDSGINRIPNEYLRKYYDNRYGQLVRTSPMISKSHLNSNNNASKDKKQIDVRQFLQMWNEGDEEQEENGSQEIITQTGSNNKNNYGKSHPHEGMNSQEQLYVLGLVNVPSDELAKYEHIQKVSKLPENIKGYNSIELLNQFEEVIESSHMNNYKTSKESMYHMPMKGTHQKLVTGVMPPRPVSPLDVEAKISQSVIHKEVGCNFEIKPCSPKMLNVEVAAPVQNILAERSIEKVANQVIRKSPLNSINENIDCNMMKRTDHRMHMSDNLRIPSCKMINTQFSSSNSMDPMKSSYSIQDLESNSGLCLASLPRLDNDIELNFPEVNQQFINANKGDTTILQTSIRDLPTLEVLDQSPNLIKDKFNNTIPSRPEYEIVKSPYMVDSEKEFTKLSKYRKTKTFEPKETLIKHNVNAFRTDSVIIKNPENIKNHEENSDFTNSLNKVIVDIQHAPINLTSQGSLSSNLESQSVNINLQEAGKEKQMPVEIAIDFSLNKTGILKSTYCMETKVESQINTSTQIAENPLDTINKDDSSDSVSLLPVLTDEENENISYMESINENCSLDCKKDGQDVPIKETNQKINTKNYVGVYSKAIAASNNKFQRIVIDEGKCSSNSAEERIVDVSSAQLVSNISSENSENESYDSDNSTTDELIDDTNCTLTEVESKISQNPPKNVVAKYVIDAAENTTNVAIDENLGEDRNFIDNINSPVQADTEKNIDTSEINNSSEGSSPVVTEQAQQPHENVLARDETCSNICANSELILSQNTNTLQTGNSEDHIECGDIIKDEAIKNKESEPSVNGVDIIFAASTPSVTGEFNETNDPYLESDQDSYEHTDIIVEPQLNSVIDTKNSNDFVINKICDDVENRTKIQSLNTDLESHLISKDVVIDQLSNDVKDETKIQSPNTNLELHPITKDFVIDQPTDDGEDGIKIQSLNTNLESHLISNDVMIDELSDDVKDESETQSVNTNSESHPITKDFVIDQPTDDGEGGIKTQSLNTNSELHPISKDFVIDQPTDDSEHGIKTQSLNTNSELYPISKDFVLDQLTDDAEGGIKIQSLNMNLESQTISKDFVIDQSTDDGEDGIKIQSLNTISESHTTSKHLVIDQTNDEVGDGTPTQSQNTNSESHLISKDFEIDHQSHDVEYSNKIVSLNTNPVLQPISKDFVMDHITDDIDDRTSIQSKNTNSESHLISKDFEIDHQSHDVEYSNKIVSLNTNPVLQPISKDFVMDHITDDIEDRTSIQSKNTNLESHPISKQFEIDHLNNDVEGSIETQSINLSPESKPISKDFEIDRITDDDEDSTESDTDDDSTSESSEEPSDSEKELMDLEETNCERTQSSPKNTDPCDLDETVDGDSERQREEPFIRNVWYGSKALYSPWIQKLLTFSEGNYNSTTAKNYINVDKDILVDFAETITTTSENNYHDVSELDITEAVLLEDAENQYIKTITKDMNEEQENSQYTVKETVDASILNLSILDNNIDESVNSENHIKREDSIEGETINTRESEPAIDEVNNIVAAGTQVVTCEFNDTNVTDPVLESGLNSSENTALNSETQLNINIVTECEEPVASNIEAVLCESFQQETEHCDEQAVNKQSEELESSEHFEHVRFSFNGLQPNELSYKKRQRLKRSLSDSALNMYNNDERPKQDDEENVQFIWPFKRRKMNTVENNLLAQKLCNIIHHNRRNSVSSFYNEENVSFCIVIDNSCIIAEEESEEPEKICYTELSEECIAEIQNSCTNHDENTEVLPEVVPSPQQENACDYSDSFVLNCEEDKTLEESWDEDVGCVETVISDDVAEDIEICGPYSPKDDALSDNDESGVFSSSEHTDRVKFIYGDKMCSDDALLVETLYKTPQMDVNKTLYNRPIRVSEQYYDNDSLEKMLSESNERPVSPYIPQCMDVMFPSGKVNSEETPENKENMDIETFPSYQSKGNALDIVVDINVDKTERENMHSIEIFAKTRETVHSCESSVDNVFTYSQRDEDAIYTSSSPEVSSTTSEEKNSGILLKITNYKGSRISQINDISRVNKRSSCKFTEEKDYLHTHKRPLLTKAAQKYIPPLKESIRDLKVKLSLPQHSLMKLKQLKLSKDEPKVIKEKSSTPRISKKPKPKFEDVLKSIDEIQFQKHKENTKKTKKAIPKVVIKKSLNGSHYASTSNKDDFNPDLTGRKWQPWVFIEKNHFIDKMATRKKTKAVYSHRQRTYVLAEKFQKYKSASSAKFVISPPISDNLSSGLKYTIRLKHNY